VVSVGATENALMAAVLATGKSTLHNAAREPEIVDLCNLLVAMGAEIEGIGTSDLTIHGVPRLHGATYRVMPDRIEAGSYACAAAITGGRCIWRAADRGNGCDRRALRDAGVHVEPVRGGIDVAAKGRSAGDHLDRALSRLRHRHAGAADGDAVPRRRYQRADRDDLREPLHACARTQPHGRAYRNQGPHRHRPRRQKLSGAEVMATDLRASMSLVIAGLAAEGETQVHRLYHLDRGYERLEEKLSAGRRARSSAVRTRRGCAPVRSDRASFPRCCSRR
jgi:UDP-N-acetylglucosamine 1-carboxyvinyltransferase